MIEQKHNIISEEFVCYVCKRKFPTQDKLKMHEEMSTLHKVIIFFIIGKFTEIE